MCLQEPVSTTHLHKISWQMQEVSAAIKPNMVIAGVLKKGDPLRNNTLLQSIRVWIQSVSPDDAKFLKGELFVHRRAAEIG
jgi:hypothetical protein